MHVALGFLAPQNPPSSSAAAPHSFIPKSAATRSKRCPEHTQATPNSYLSSCLDDGVDAMILRAYMRRSRSFSDGEGGVSSSQDAFDCDDAADLLVSSASQPLPLPPSQESSSMWDFDEDPPPSPPRPRPEGRRRGTRRGGWELVEAPTVAPTATLMEAEEYGEMMESVDEVTFTLDGLRPAAQKRTRRASLLALLGIYASAERHRVLRSQG
jgi:hypothetical protein